MTRDKLLSLGALALVVMLCASSIRSITGAPIISDAEANLRMSLNLAHHGVISQHDTPPYLPTMYREPLPAIVSAGVIGIADALMGKADDAQYFSGAYARAVKYQNVAWLLLLATGVLVAVRGLTSSIALSAAGVVLLFVKVPATPTTLPALGIDTLETDLAAAGLLLWGSIHLWRAMAWSSRLHFVFAGLFFGALAVTKAAFLYIFIGVLLGTWLLPVLFRDRASLGRGPVPVGLLLMAAACTAVTVPWMLRNSVQLDTFSITQRGGLVLLLRAEKDRMTAEEYRGTFYIWAPEKLRPLMGRLLGYTPADLNRGGRLQHIYRDEDSDHFESDLAAESDGRPDLALSYYHRVRAQRVQLQHRFGDGPEATLKVDEELQHRAMTIIKEHPWRHLGTTVPFLWRGATTTFPILVLALTFALVRRDRAGAAFVLPGMGLVMFYALFSHFVPRYSMPAVGVTLVAGLTLLAPAWQALRKRFIARGRKVAAA